MTFPRMTTQRWLIAADCIVALSFIAGLIVGAVHGLHDYQAAVDEAIADGLTADYLPVGVPIRAAIGACMGVIVGLVAAACWLLTVVACRFLAVHKKKGRLDDLS